MPRYEARPHPRPRIPSHLGVAGVGREVEGRGVGVEGGRADVGAAAEQLAHRGKVPRMARPVQRRPPVMCVRVLLLLLLLLLPSIGVRSIWCSSATPATTAATTTKNTATTKRMGNAAQGKCIARAFFSFLLLYVTRRRVPCRRRRGRGAVGGAGTDRRPPVSHETWPP